jgi:nicotinamidase-related amidase
MKKALILIDYVNDFVSDSGSLTCGKPAQNIDQFISKTVTAFNGGGHFIITANDNHKLKDNYNPETRLFPAHCIEGTEGALIYGETAKSVSKVKQEQLHFVGKTRYSAFAGTDLDLYLREREVKDVYLAGVCTDICVLHAAIDAYNLGYRVHVYEKGVASFDPKGHAFALNHIKTCLGGIIL